MSQEQQNHDIEKRVSTLSKYIASLAEPKLDFEEAEEALRAIIWMTYELEGRFIGRLTITLDVDIPGESTSHQAPEDSGRSSSA